MVGVVEVHDREPIERFARRDLGLHIYEVGDLDPFFWPYTKWYGLRGDDGELRALALVYERDDPPVLLALGREDEGAIVELVSGLRPRLPQRFYAHLSEGVPATLAERWQLEHHGRYLKMLLTDPSEVARVKVDDVERLGPDDVEDLQALYGRAYPGNWFDARMLDTGQYFGIRRDGQIVCVAGVHVYSPRYRVAALGNVTTDPQWRGRGLARRATAYLCRSLAGQVDTLGLNVREDNAAAIACYRCLGFDVIATYDEYMAEPGQP